MEIIEEIASNIATYQEDHPEVIITDEIIKGIIEQSIDEITKEVRKVLDELH